jgi:hypothetical protein
LLHPALGFAGTRRIKPGRSASQHRQSSFNSSRAQVLRRQLLELSPHESIGVFDLFRYYIHHTTAQVAFFEECCSHLALIFRSSDQCDCFSSVLAPLFSGKFLLFSTLFSVFITEVDLLWCAHLSLGNWNEKKNQNKSCAVFTWQDEREGKKTNKHKIKVVEWCSGRRARRRWPLTGWPPFGPAECKCLFGHLRDAHSTSSLFKPPSHIPFFFFFHSLRFVKDQHNKIVLETKMWKKLQ